MSDDHNILPDHASLSEQEVQRVIERAIQLDTARGSETTVAELRRVALELNISSAAITQALQELASKAVVTPATVTPATPQPAIKSRLGSWWRALAIGFASFSIGAMDASKDRYPGPSLILMFAAIIALIIKHRRDGTPREFQKDILVLFAAMVLAWSGYGVRHMDEVVYSMSLGWMVTWAVGGFLVAFTWPWKKTDPPNLNFGGTHS